MGCQIYSPAVKTGLMKTLACLWHGPHKLKEQVVPVSFRVKNVQQKLILGTVHDSHKKHLGGEQTLNSLGLESELKEAHNDNISLSDSEGSD